MKRKYKKQKAVMVDLSDRKNIKIIESEKVVYSDRDVEIFREQVDIQTKAIKDFNNYVIKKEIDSKRHISDEEFSNTMKELIKKHKILKCMLKEQG